MNTHNNTPVVTADEDFNLVEMWLRMDPIRWVAGAMAGIFATLVMLAFAGVLSAIGGSEFWFPVKMGALPVLGNVATAFGFNLGSILVGLAMHSVLGAILGLVYAHFVGTNSMSALLPMGVVWGLFTWIFIHNLFVQSIRDVLATQFSRGASFFVALVFGLSLASVAFFDGIVRGRKYKY